MPRYKLIIEYDGTPFHGWQQQDNVPSVQGALADAVKAFSGEDFVPRGAGRTDAGVHALKQVAHLDLARHWEPNRIREALNFHLKPAPIVVLNCAEVPNSFDARFSASGRHYLYRIFVRRPRPVLDINRVWHVPVPLELDAMRRAAQHLQGRHDFSAFRSSHCQASSPIKTIDKIALCRIGDEIEIRVSARSFLHHQVRSFAGVLKRVGEGKWQPEDVKAVRDSHDRRKCASMAPAAGLYLLGVDYEDDASKK